MDNFFTGRKRNVEHWIGHENFELLNHDVVNPLYIEGICIDTKRACLVAVLLELRGKPKYTYFPCVWKCLLQAQSNGSFTPSIYVCDVFL